MYTTCACAVNPSSSGPGGNSQKLCSTPLTQNARAEVGGHLNLWPLPCGQTDHSLQGPSEGKRETREIETRGKLVVTSQKKCLLRLSTYTYTCMQVAWQREKERHHPPSSRYITYMHIHAHGTKQFGRVIITKCNSNVVIIGTERTVKHGPAKGIQTN